MVFPALLTRRFPGSYGEDRDWLLRASYQKPLAALQEVMTVVEWGHSKFQRDWSTIAKALTYLMEKHPAPGRGGPVADLRVGSPSPRPLRATRRPHDIWPSPP